MLASNLLSTAPGRADELHRLQVCGRNRNAVRISSRAARRSIRICCATQNGHRGWLEPVAQLWWDRMSTNAGVLVGAAALCFASGLVLPKSAKAFVGAAPQASAAATAAATGSLPDDFSNRLKMPDVGRRRAMYRKTIGRVREALEKDPANELAQRELLQAFMAAGETEKAISVLSKLIKLHPRDFTLRFMKAKSYEMTGKHRMARDEYKTLVKMQPFWGQALHGLAFAMKRCGEPEFKVLQTIRDAVIDAKHHNQAGAAKDFKLLLAQMLTLYDKSEEAMALYEEMVKDYPDDFRIYLCQGLLHDTLDNLDEARECYKKYKELCPETFCNCYINHMLVRGRGYNFNREEDEALAPLLPLKVKQALAELRAEKAGTGELGSGKEALTELKAEKTATGELDFGKEAAAVAS